MIKIRYISSLVNMNMEYVFSAADPLSQIEVMHLVIFDNPANL